jgi:hypothetical protein
MVSVREPVLHPIPILTLRPTQMTVGMREVEEKRKRWREQGGKKKGEFLGKHMLPAILGPKDRYYIVDHHHLARALHEEGETNVLVTVVADLRSLSSCDEFWFVLENRSWAHTYDANGVRHSYEDIPKSIDKLKDDPFRSLAGQMRRAGGFAKDTTPFSEFLWADFMRRRLKAKLVKSDFAAAMEQAMALAKSPSAVHLPGWCGPHPDH